jgi:transcriptional regulator with XRE-family HTH domain
MLQSEEYREWQWKGRLSAMPKRPDLNPGDTERMRRMARRLRLLREILTPSQVEGAEAAGESASTWNRYENNKGRIDLFALVRFCDTFNVTTDWVLRGRTEGMRSEVAIRLLRAARDEPELLAGQGDIVAPAGLSLASSPPGARRMRRKLAAHQDH